MLVYRGVHVDNNFICIDTVIPLVSCHSLMVTVNVPRRVKQTLVLKKIIMLAVPYGIGEHWRAKGKFLSALCSAVSCVIEGVLGHNATNGVSCASRFNIHYILLA